MCYIVTNVMIIVGFINHCQEIIKKLYTILINELFLEKKTHIYIYIIQLIVFFNILDRWFGLNL